MLKSIFKIVGFLSVAAVFCVGCGDKNDDGPDDNEGGGTKSSYTITFDPTGGTVNPTSTKTGDDGKLASLPEPTKDGYTFDGWYTAETGGTAVMVSKVYSANTTIYARWTEEPITPPDTTNPNDTTGGGGTKSSYTVIFDPNGGTVSHTSAKTGDGGKLDSLPTPTRNGYTFDGWYTAETSGTVVTESEVYSANTTIYARWTAEPVTPPSGNTFTDSRDSKTYKKIVIGTQTWMAENLNYDVPSNTTDVCYRNSADSCAKYGRLYNWSTAMTACPVGWHLPSDAEWTQLTDYVGGLSTAGTKLKSTSGWYNNGNGTDQYGFSALPAGLGYSDGSFYGAGDEGYWWSATEYGAYYAYYRYMYYNLENVGRGSLKTYLFSVRCVQD